MRHMVLVFFDRLFSVYPFNVRGDGDFDVGYFAFAIGAAIFAWGLARMLVDRRSRLAKAESPVSTPYRASGEVARHDVDAATGLDAWELTALARGKQGVALKLMEDAIFVGALVEADGGRRFTKTSRAVGDTRVAMWVAGLPDDLASAEVADAAFAQADAMQPALDEAAIRAGLLVTRDARRAGARLAWAVSLFVAALGYLRAVGLLLLRWPPSDAWLVPLFLATFVLFIAIGLSISVARVRLTLEGERYVGERDAH